MGQLYMHWMSNDNMRTPGRRQGFRTEESPPSRSGFVEKWRNFLRSKLLSSNEVLVQTLLRGQRHFGF
jgi:hypothetical protein